jgi:hypothetical protein
MSQILEGVIAQSRTLFPAQKLGFLLIHLKSPVEDATALVTEHRGFGNEQFMLKFQDNLATGRVLPEGGYTVAVFAPGYAPGRSYIEVVAGHTATVKADLQKGSSKILTFMERLHKYGLEKQGESAEDLSLTKGQLLRLDPNSHKANTAAHQLKLGSVDQVKNILGNPDAVFPGGEPRFGPVMADREPQGPVALDQSVNEGFRAALREYVYGNSASVAKWKNVLNKWVVGEAINWPIFLYNIITVGPGATLQVASSGIVCDILRVHTTGTVEVVAPGPCTVDTGSYEDFS